MYTKKFSKIKNINNSNNKNKTRYCVTISKYDNSEITFVAQNYYKSSEDAHKTLLSLENEFKEDDTRIQLFVIDNIDEHIQSKFENRDINLPKSTWKCSIL